MLELSSTAAIEEAISNINRRRYNFKVAGPTYPAHMQAVPIQLVQAVEVFPGSTTAHSNSTGLSSRTISLNLLCTKPILHSQGLFVDTEYVNYINF